jgi:hypothetical protein
MAKRPRRTPTQLPECSKEVNLQPDLSEDTAAAEDAIATAAARMVRGAADRMKSH